MKKNNKTGVKFLAIGTLLVTSLAGFSETSSAAQVHNIQVKVNETIIQMYEAPAYVEDNVTYVPLRFVSDALGAEIDYENNKEPITARIDKPTENEVKVLLNSNKVEVNGTIQEYNGTVKLQKGRTMVPLRVISEGLGAVVKWDSKSNTAEITTPWETPAHTSAKPPASNTDNTTYDAMLGLAWKPNDMQKPYASKVFKGITWNSKNNTLSFNMPDFSGKFVLSGMKEGNKPAEKVTLGKDYTLKNLDSMFKIAITIYTDKTMTSYVDQYQIMTYDYANRFYGKFDPALKDSLIVLDQFNRKVPIEAVYEGLGIKNN